MRCVQVEIEYVIYANGLVVLLTVEQKTSSYFKSTFVFNPVLIKFSEFISKVAGY
jgi:hypothetical protein